ncbi:peptidoglycan DD-metalloendopeptidase family protein [Isoalcanivorax beigongshangi]|uniref:Peptidoglycan DD-metalloendopeptidase family protein n=1 Tax=Isoalcanivorax beigongshangi TaxID=3238810 RepID=A0ABV4AF89_9GAMM
MRGVCAGLLCVTLLFSGCATGAAPVVEYQVGGPRGPKPPQVTRGNHTVKKGDTLFSIAWRYGWDYRELAAANGIAAPYTIHPGQRIHLDRSVPGARPAPTPRPTPAPTPAPRSTPTPAPAPAPTPAPAPRPAPSPSQVADVAWRWPVPGQVLSGFSAQRAGPKGITLAGREGEPVRAAAAGVVVYRGNALTGYGNLLIIKHNARWLSAYAHTDDVLVKEGDSIQSGQQVATMGSSGTFRTQLLFEVRRDGKPIDPLTVLPRR